MIEPLFNGILFVFIDDFSKGMFNEETDWGFQVGRTSDNSAKAARWGKVMAVGPDVVEEDAEVGTYVLIEPLMWTKGIEHDGYQVWKTDISKVLAVSDDFPT